LLPHEPPRISYGICPSSAYPYKQASELSDHSIALGSFPFIFVLWCPGGKRLLCVSAVINPYPNLQNFLIAPSAKEKNQEV